jgi:hypothetical protein
VAGDQLTLNSGGAKHNSSVDTPVLLALRQLVPLLLDIWPLQVIVVYLIATAACKANNLQSAFWNAPALLLFVISSSVRRNELLCRPDTHLNHSSCF